MNQYKPKSLWVAGAAATAAAVVASVVAIGPKVFVADGADAEKVAQPLPLPAGPIPDYPEQAPEYDVDECEYSESPVDEPAAISPSGEYIAGHTLWGPDGEIAEYEQNLDPKFAPSGLGPAINSRGMVVGTPNPWVYYEGEAVEVPLPEEVDDPKEVHLTDLNEDGDVAGFITVSNKENNRSNTEYVPVRWDAGASTPTVLETGDNGAEIAGITEDGEVIGVEFEHTAALEIEFSNYGEIWKWDRDGNRETLPISGKVVNVAGDWILGTEYPNKHYRWNMAEDEDPQRVSLGTAIDTSGRVFGTKDERAAIETDSGVEELPVPQDRPDDASYHVTAVSPNTGLIGGTRNTGEEKDYKTKPILWRCADN